MTFISPPSSVQVVTTETPVPVERDFPPAYQNPQAVPFGPPFTTAIFPGIGFEVRVYDATSPNGTPIAYIPNPQSVTFEDVLNDVGSIQITTATDDMPSTVWAKDNIWKVYWQGIEVFAGIGEQLHDSQITGTESRDRTLGGKGIAQWLDKMKVYPLNWGTSLALKPTQTFSNASHASVIRTLLLQGQARGTIPWMSMYNWTATKDSMNVAWPDVNTLSVDTGVSMLSLITDYGTATPFDWHVDNKGRLALWKHAGVNRGVQIKVHPAGRVISSEITTDTTNLWDVVLVEDSNQGFTEQKDNPTVTSWGRREFFASSTTVIDTAGRGDLALSLLQQYMAPAVQKVVEIDTSLPGSPLPYIDYFLGDTINVEFIDGSISPARVIGIAMNGGTGTAETIQLTLDFIINQVNSNVAGTSTGVISTASTGSQVVFGDNTGSTNSVTSSPVIYIQLQVEAFTDTYAEIYSFIRGQASVAMTMQADVLLDGNTIRTMKQNMSAGEQTWSPVFMLSALPESIHTAWLRLSVSTGSFAIASGDLQFWFEGPNINGGVGGSSPLIAVTDAIQLSIQLPTIVPQFDSLSRQTPIAINPPHLNLLSSFATVSDSASDGVQSSLWQGYIQSVAASGDDGDTSTGPSFTITATQLEAGNDGGTIWGSFARFVIPSPGFQSSAVTVTRAFLSGTVDQNDNNASIIIQAEHAASPTAPTTRADYLARTLTTASAIWTPGSVVSAQAVNSPSLVSVIQELITAFGNTITAINIFWQDNGGPVNGKILLRSFDNAANQPPKLNVYWHI